MVHESGAQEWCTRVVHESARELIRVVHEGSAREDVSGAREWCTRVREWCTRLHECVSGA